MHVEFLLEEPSAEEALRLLLPKILPTDSTFELRNLQDKGRLLRKLKARLQGYSNWNIQNMRVVVLVDRDDDNCQELKQQLEAAAQAAGLAGACPLPAARRRPATPTDRRRLLQVPGRG